MTASAENLLKQALDLRASERALLVEKLLLSLDTPDEAIDAIWGWEADARVAAYEAGEVDSVPVSKEEYLQERAKQGTREHALGMLDRVADVEPPAYDKF